MYTPSRIRGAICRLNFRLSSLHELIIFMKHLWVTNSTNAPTFLPSSFLNRPWEYRFKSLFVCLPLTKRDHCSAVERDEACWKVPSTRVHNFESFYLLSHCKLPSFLKCIVLRFHIHLSLSYIDSPSEFFCLTFPRIFPCFHSLSVIKFWLRGWENSARWNSRNSMNFTLNALSLPWFRTRRNFSLIELYVFRALSWIFSFSFVVNCFISFSFFKSKNMKTKIVQYFFRRFGDCGFEALASYAGRDDEKAVDNGRWPGVWPFWELVCVGYSEGSEKTWRNKRRVC